MLERKIVITCACTGAETTREQNPALPVTVPEVARAAAEARQAGAAILHLHVRTDDGRPTTSPARFAEVLAAVRRATDIVVEITTGGAVGDPVEERLAPLTQLEPEMASLDCGTVNFGDEYIVNALPTMRAFAEAFREHGVRPTLECFDLGHVYASRTLVEAGLVEPPLHYGLVLNVPGGVPYSLANLEAFRRALPAGAAFTVMGIGRASLPAQYGAVAAGGWIRVGFEDNVYLAKGVLAGSNAELVERAAHIARLAGLEVAAPEDVRRGLELRR